MPALKPTQYNARITWLGTVTPTPDSIRSAPCDHLELTWEGVAADSHAGINRPSCSRLLKQYPRGTEIRNVRQLSIVSAEELAQIAEAMGIRQIAPEWLGATMVVEGIPNFSHIPPSSRLQLADGGMLVVDMENRPCGFPAREIEREHEGFGKRFAAAARGKRGITAWVERPGHLRLGEDLQLHIPHQPIWAHIESVL
jgi:hypothetical protein